MFGWRSDRRSSGSAGASRAGLPALPVWSASPVSSSPRSGETRIHPDGALAGFRQRAQFLVADVGVDDGNAARPRSERTQRVHETAVVDAIGRRLHHHASGRTQPALQQSIIGDGRTRCNALAPMRRGGKPLIIDLVMAVAAPCRHIQARRRRARAVVAHGLLDRRRPGAGAASHHACKNATSRDGLCPLPAARSHDLTAATAAARSALRPSRRAQTAATAQSSATGNIPSTKLPVRS